MTSKAGLSVEEFPGAVTWCDMLLLHSESPVGKVCIISYDKRKREYYGTGQRACACGCGT